jgi:hypothetical protein
VERDGDAAQACTVKLEADEANVDLLVKGVELRPGGDKAVEQDRVDGVVEHHEVDPFGGEEDTVFHGCGLAAGCRGGRFRA